MSHTIRFGHFGRFGRVKSRWTFNAETTYRADGFSPCRRVSSGYGVRLRSWQKAAGRSALKSRTMLAAFSQDFPPAPLTLAGDGHKSPEKIHPHSTGDWGRCGYPRAGQRHESRLLAQSVCASPTERHTENLRQKQKERNRQHHGLSAGHGHSLRSCPSLDDVTNYNVGVGTYERSNTFRCDTFIHCACGMPVLAKASDGAVRESG